MKKNLLLFAFICTQTFVHAQFNIGGNAILQIPQGDFKNISKFGYGGSASVGYTFDQRIELSFVYTIYGYSSPADFLKLNSKTAEAKFFFLNGNTRPYIGCGVGLFTSVFEWNLFSRQKENNWGFEPKAGVLLDSRMLNNLFVDASISYFNIYINHNDIKAFNIAVGLKYMIDFKKGSM